MKREDDGLTFDLEPNEAAAALWLTTFIVTHAPAFDELRVITDQYKCSLDKVFAKSVQDVDQMALSQRRYCPQIYPEWHPCFLSF
jgi:hypothetical protein